MLQTFDVVICGGGLVGASLALALKPSGLRVAVVEPQRQEPAPEDGSWDNRIYAISPGSAAFLEQCGVWQGLPSERVIKVEEMRVYGDNEGSLLAFTAYDAGLPELAFIVENRLLHEAAWKCLEASEHVRIFCPGRGAALTWSDEQIRLGLDDAGSLEAKLIVGADGADSWLRSEAKVESGVRDYGQLGVVANFALERPHRNAAYQWFHPSGVLALLPLQGDYVSMVWSTAESQARELLAFPHDELARQVAIASRYELGPLRLITPPAAFPLRLQRVSKLIKRRLALAGDAAHTVHPLAGQGINLGFRDARELGKVLCSRGAETDCGDYALLRRYERARKGDVLAIQFLTHTLQKLFNNDMVTVGWARNLGLRVVDGLPPLKNALIRQAVG